jgi:RNA polymerase sigma-70 factor (ECF subfamily)
MWLFSKKQKRSDEELVAIFYKSGDQSAFGELFEKHLRVVYGACLYYVSNKSRAQDLTMQIFEKLMLELRRTQPTYFKGWLSFVVRNYCINELKRSKNTTTPGDAYLEREYTVPEMEEEERNILVKQEKMLSLLSDVLPLLKQDQRVCVEAFYLRKKSYEQIAEDFGFMLNEVKSHIQNGKRNLKLLIEQNISKNE